VQEYDRELSREFSRVDSPIRTETVLELWGESDEVETAADGSEVWTYDADLRWRGLLICVVIAIPMVVPAGHETKSLVIQDGTVLAVTSLDQLATLYVAGVVPGICYDFGVGVFCR
jgi:hypothetical protein